MSNASRKPKKFSEMQAREKVVFILKLAVCIVSFGMIFPNIMSD